MGLTPVELPPFPGSGKLCPGPTFGKVITIRNRGRGRDSSGKVVVTSRNAVRYAMG